MDPRRRRFMHWMGAGALAAAMPQGLARALSIPARRRTGTIADVEHVVILMQENRSFDHYFGTLSGVRGFGDPRPARLPSGKPVWNQPDGAGGELLPWRPAVPDAGLAYLSDPPHGWNDGHAAWNGGAWDRWVPSKGRITMAHLAHADLPYHHALADAFTICDGYHCSLIGPTDPNRYHMWTGWVGNDGSGGGPVITNAEAGYDWSTYPERLQMAGISWKVYQDVGVGLTAPGYWGWTEDAFIGNYGDNSLLYFHQYQHAPAGTPLAENARTGTNVSAGGTLFDVLREDVRTGRLPQVSWITAPEAWSEHPNWPANYGAWYIDQVLQALTANPEVWSKTVLFVTWDEDGGFFDHVVSPTPPQTRAQGLSTVDVRDEIFPGDASHPAGPYGLGVRVPLLVVSPWSKGGWVNSQVFDHTSLIRFLEARFGPHHPGLVETNITPWRRAVVGDLTSTLDFARGDDDGRVVLPSTARYLPPDHLRHPDDALTPPAAQALPAQEKGRRRTRALPYELHVHGALQGDGTFRLDFANTGGATAVFQVRSARPSEAPRSYTVEPDKALADTWLAAHGHDLTVHGPNGFFRAYRGGGAGERGTRLDVRAEYERSGAVVLVVVNAGAERRDVTVVDGYGGTRRGRSLAPGERWVHAWGGRRLSGWYDLSVGVAGDPAFAVALAGHVETGADGLTDPAIGGGEREEREAER